MKRLTIQEAFEALTPEEQQRMRTLPPAIASGVSNLIGQMRRRGKQIDIKTAASQLSQFAKMQGREVPPELLTLAGEVVAPPQEIMQAPRTSIPSPMQAQPTQRPSLASLRQKKPVSTSRSKKGKVDVSRLKKAPTQIPGLGQRTPIAPEHQVPLEQTAQQVRQSEESAAPDPFAQRLAAKKAKRAARVEKPTVRFQQQKKSFEPGAFAKTNPPSARPRMIESRILAKKILKEQVTIQLETKQQAEILLEALPSVWQSLKSAGTAAMGKLGGGYKSLAKDAATSQREQKVKEISGAIEKAIKKAESQRQKFNSQVLKSAQMMNAYHSAVLRAFEIYKRFEDVLGPAGMQINRQVNNVLEALEDDLMSEVSQIEAMLKNIGSKDKTLDSRMKIHKQKAAQKREKEAEAEARMQSSFGRTEERMPSKVKLPKVDVKPRQKEAEDPKALKKVKLASYKKRMKQAQRSAIGGTKAEREDALKEMYALMKMIHKLKKELGR